MSFSFSAQAENLVKDLFKPVQAEAYWLVQMSVYTLNRTTTTIKSLIKIVVVQ